MPQINKENRNRYALVTGGTSGIGYELAKLLAKDGYNLILVARNSQLLEQTSDELKQQFSVEVTPLAVDLFRCEAADEIHQKVVEMGVTVDVLINDAGQGEWGPFLASDTRRDCDIIQLNITSLVALTKIFGREMVARNEGKILFLGSEAGESPMPLLGVYAATKAFVISFAMALNNELQGTNVTTTVLMPGATDTDFFHKAHMETTVTYKEKELASPADVAKDGYEAMMKGVAKVISGMKTKLHVFMADMMGDVASAINNRKLMEESDKDTPKRTGSGHAHSKMERAEINAATGQTSGDYPKGDHTKEVVADQAVS